MFEWLFRYPRSAFADGELVFASALDARWLPVVLVAAALVIAASLWRAPGLRNARGAVVGLLQFAAVALVACWLFAPVLVVERPAPGRNAVAIVVDVSRSMSLPAAAAATAAASTAAMSRRAQAEALAADLAARLAGRYRTHDHVFAERAQRLPADAGWSGSAAVPAAGLDGGETRIGEALAEVFAAHRGEPLAAVVLISDGAGNGSPRALDAALAHGLPVHTVGVGPEVLAGDVELAAVRVPPRVLPGARVQAELTLAHAASGSARVSVYDGDALLARQDVTLRAGAGSQQAGIELPSGDVAVRDLRFVVEPLAGETVTANNTRSALLQVEARRDAVLYLEGEPRFEYKFLRRALADDASLRLASWLRTTPRKSYRQGIESPEELASGFPASRDALFAYALVLVGNLPATHFTQEQLRWLADFVGERGGALLLLHGRAPLPELGYDVTPLAPVLPVRVERAQEGTGGDLPAPCAGGGCEVLPTDAGRRSPLLRIAAGTAGDDAWATLPPLADVGQLPPPKPAASVLLEARAGGAVVPLLVTQRYGHGVAAVLAAGDTWRWQMRTPPEDTRHQRFWRQLAGELARGAATHVDARAEVSGNDVDVVVSARDRGFGHDGQLDVTVRLSGAHGTASAVAVRGDDGTWRARVVAAGPGIHRLEASVADAAGPLGQHLSHVRIGGAPAEDFHPAQDRATLERIAAASGGRYWQADAVPALAAAIDDTAAGVRVREQWPLRDVPAGFLLLALLKCTEWGLRRRWVVV